MAATPHFLVPPAAARPHVLRACLGAQCAGVNPRTRLAWRGADAGGGPAAQDSHLASVYSLGRLIDIVDDGWAADTLEFDGARRWSALGRSGGLTRRRRHGPDLQAPPDMEPNTEDGPVGQSVVGASCCAPNRAALTLARAPQLAPRGKRRNAAPATWTRTWTSAGS